MIVPARDAAATIGRQLEALARQSSALPWEVIVVDDGSTDNTRSVVSEHQVAWSALRIADGPGRGAGAARNAGASLASGDLLCFCDADDVVAPGWLAALVAGLARADAVGGRCVPMGVGDAEAQNPLPSRTDGLIRWDGYLPYAISANFGIRRLVFELLGGFDEGSTAEDVDLCWRLQESGYVLVGARDAVVDYRVRTTTRALMTQRYRYGKRKPWLYQRHCQAGMPASGLLHGARRWFALIVSLPWSLRNQSARREWNGELAFRAGTVVGSVQHRAIHL